MDAPTGARGLRLTAQYTSVPPRRINEIIHGKRGITADTALRLARYFGNSPHFWLNLQSRYALEMARDKLGERLESEVQPLAAGPGLGSYPQGLFSSDQDKAPLW